MNRNRTIAIVIIVLAVLFLIYVFFINGGAGQVDELGTPGASTDATSTEPAAE
jgi:hypothetical protein